MDCSTPVMAEGLWVSSLSVSQVQLYPQTLLKKAFTDAGRWSPSLNSCQDAPHDTAPSQRDGEAIAAFSESADFRKLLSPYPSTNPSFLHKQVSVIYVSEEHGIYPTCLQQQLVKGGFPSPLPVSEAGHFG